MRIAKAPTGSAAWLPIMGFGSLIFVLVSCSDSAARTGSIELHDAITLASTDSSVDLQARVPAVALSGDYFAYVDMPPNGAAAVFDTRGKFVSTIGGPGGGPGEFHQITSAGFGVADTIWILDGMVTAHAFSPAPIVRYVRSVELDHVTLGQITALGIVAPSALYGEVVRPATLTGWDGHEAARFVSEHRKADADRVMGPGSGVSLLNSPPSAASVPSAVS